MDSLPSEPPGKPIGIHKFVCLFVLLPFIDSVIDEWTLNLHSSQLAAAQHKILFTSPLCGAYRQKAIQNDFLGLFCYTK